MLGGRASLYAGGRYTREQGANWASGAAGAWYWRGPLSAHLGGCLGTEHWAANWVSPSILSIAPRTHAGGIVTLLWHTTRWLRVAGQAEGYTLASEGATGSFWSVSLGAQARIFSL